MAHMFERKALKVACYSKDITQFIKQSYPCTNIHTLEYFKYFSKNINCGG